MRAALIQESDNEVENIILVGDDYETPEGHYLIDATGLPLSPGDTYDPGNDEFIPTDKPEPEPTLEDRIASLESRLDELESNL